MFEIFGGRKKLNIQLIFFDMEGTIFQKQQTILPNGKMTEHPSLWSRLMSELGKEAQDENEQTVKKWDSGLYTNYIEWCIESLKIYQKYGLTKELFENTTKSIQYNEYVKKTFAILNKKCIKTAIVSGGFIEQARRAQRDLLITHAYASVELYWNSSGNLFHWNILPTDFVGKVDFVRLLMKEYNLRPHECAFIGDGKNDIYVAKEVGCSFSYRGHADLNKIATHRVDNFSDILSKI
jgi:phosphoserine phosphatase